MPGSIEAVIDLFLVPDAQVGKDDATNNLNEARTIVLEKIASLAQADPGVRALRTYIARLPKTAVSSDPAVPSTTPLVGRRNVEAFRAAVAALSKQDTALLAVDFIAAYRLASGNFGPLPAVAGLQELLASRYAIIATFGHLPAQTARAVGELQRIFSNLQQGLQDTQAELEAMFKRGQESFAKDLQAEVDGRRSQIAKVASDAKAQISDLSKSVGKALSRASAAERSIADISAGADALSERIVTLGNEQASALKALQEQVRFDQARTLWGNAGKRAAIAFNVSSVVLAAALVGIPYLAFVYRGEVVEFLQSYEAAIAAGAAGDGFAATVSAVGKLLLITAPLGFVVWLIRLLVRFNMRSMLLMDDARQRVAILNTYLYLIEHDAATKQDRGAVLEALFRRAPGHGSDTAEPPHFTELLKYGQDAPSHKS